MHTALQLAPVLAEKSKTPFYLAGGILVAWALVVSMAIGMRRPNFPAGLSQQRAIMAVSVVLVLVTVSMAVVVSGGEDKAGSATAATPSAPAETTPAPEATTTPQATKPAETTASTPTATTGTPAPPSSPAAKATQVPLAADPGGQLAYDTRTLTAKAGKVSIVMSNASPVEHDVAIAEGSKVLGQTPTFVGGSKTVTLNLKPGTYTFYCTVPGHRQAGMEGKLTVTG